VGERQSEKRGVQKVEKKNETRRDRGEKKRGGKRSPEKRVGQRHKEKNVIKAEKRNRTTDLLGAG